LLPLVTSFFFGPALSFRKVGKVWRGYTTIPGCISIQHRQEEIDTDGVQINYRRALQEH
jgi:hypothetical protein